MKMRDDARPAEGDDLHERRVGALAALMVDATKRQNRPDQQADRDSKRGKDQRAS